MDLLEKIPRDNFLSALQLLEEAEVGTEEFQYGTVQLLIYKSYMEAKIQQQEDEESEDDEE